MSKTNHELTHRILSMSSQAEEKHHDDRETVAETQEAADKRESHIHVVPFNPVQTGSFQ